MCLLCLATWTGGAHAQSDSDPPSKPTTATAPEVLVELPEVPSSKFGRPTEEAMTELKELLQRVRSTDAVVRERAVRAVLEASPAWVPAIYHHLNQIADDADRGAMKEMLRKIRRRARNDVREQMRRRGERGKVVTPDYLTMVAEYAEPQHESWQALISVLAMSRMLVAVGSTEASRALIQIYVRFGEFLRVDTQLQLAELGERAAPALVEARKHPAAKIGSWANRQLDQMGKAIASELVQTEDQQVLADTLRAYGRIQDPDAARIIISFANSERAQIRLAARQAVRLLGETGNWQLREAYQNIIGKNPPRDWSWKRTARELFHEFDRLRLARVHALFDAGMAAQKKSDFAAMREAFDKVLANNPMFDGRDQMVDGYVAYASQLDSEQLDDAIVALRRAERINSDPKRQPALTSLRLTLEGERLLQRGLADQTAFRRALELDPTNQRAREGIALIERGERQPQPEYSRYYGAGAIGIVALLAILLIVVWRPKPTAASPTSSQTDHRSQLATQPASSPGGADAPEQPPTTQPASGPGGADAPEQPPAAQANPNREPSNAGEPAGPGTGPAPADARSTGEHLDATEPRTVTPPDDDVPTETPPTETPPTETPPTETPPTTPRGTLDDVSERS